MEYITDRDTLNAGDYCTCLMGAFSGTDYVIFMKMIDEESFVVKMQIGDFARDGQIVDVVQMFGDWIYTPPMDRHLYRLDFQEICQYIVMGEL